MPTDFGEFLVQKRLQSGIPAKWLAENLGISPVYMCDIEKGRRRISDELLPKLAKLLLLSEDECYEMYDLAAKTKKAVSADLAKYIMRNAVIRSALRTAQKHEISDEMWREFIAQIIVHGDKK